MLYLCPNICSLMILCLFLAADDGSRLWHADDDGVQYAANWLHEIVLSKAQHKVPYSTGVSDYRTARLDHLAFAVMLVRCLSPAQ